jgi:hypothetical protein
VQLAPEDERLSTTHLAQWIFMGFAYVCTIFEVFNEAKLFLTPNSLPTIMHQLYNYSTPSCGSQTSGG